MTHTRSLRFRAALVAVALMVCSVLAEARNAGTVIEGVAGRNLSSTALRVSVGAAGSGPPDSTDSDDFYYRAGILVDWPSGTHFLDESCESGSPAALYGCGDGNDGLPLGTYGDFAATPGFEFGVGLVAASALRLEGVLAYRPGAAFKGRANFLQTTEQQDVAADSSVFSAMFAAYVDLPGPGLPRLGSLRPFVGAGGGFSRIEIDQTRMVFPRTTTIVPEGHKINLAWMLAAGVSAPLGSRATIEIAWRFTDHGVIETGRGKGRVLWRDGSRVPLELDLAKTRARLEGHGVAVSLRLPF